MKPYFKFTHQFKLFYFILGFIFILSYSCKLCLSYLSSKGIYLYYNKILTDDLLTFLVCIRIVTIFIFLSISLIRRKLKIITILLCTFSIFTVYSYNSGYWEANKAYFEFTSPNNKTIIIEECSWLLGGWSNVYQKARSNILIDLKANILTDDGFTPFSHNAFRIEWTSNSVIITYEDRNENIEEVELFLHEYSFN